MYIYIHEYASLQQNYVLKMPQTKMKTCSALSLSPFPRHFPAEVAQHHLGLQEVAKE